MTFQPELIQVVLLFVSHLVGVLAADHLSPCISYYDGLYTNAVYQIDMVMAVK